MKAELPVNLINFDASRFNYGHLVAEAAPETWTINRYDEDGERYAIDEKDSRFCIFNAFRIRCKINRKKD